MTAADKRQVGGNLTKFHQHRNDPIIAAALAGHGINPENPEQRKHALSEDLAVYAEASGTLPWTYCDETIGWMMNWPAHSANQPLLVYLVNEEGGLFVVSADLPDTVVNAAPGMLLSNIVDVPGASQQRIVRAYKADDFAGNGKKTHFCIENVATDI